jgi:hypothetical protein
MAKKKKSMIPLISGSAVAVLIFIWLALPIIAGAFKIGESDGPKIYPKKLHIAFYGIGHSAAGHGETEDSYFKALIYERPWFYGMKRKLIPQAKAEDVIDGTKEWIEDKYNQVME